MLIGSNVVCISFSIIGNPENRHVVIIDDLIQTGGTLKECGKVGLNSISIFTLNCQPGAFVAQ